MRLPCKTRKRLLLLEWKQGCRCSSGRNKYDQNHRERNASAPDDFGPREPYGRNGSLVLRAKYHPLRGRATRSDFARARDPARSRWQRGSRRRDAGRCLGRRACIFVWLGRKNTSRPTTAWGYRGAAERKYCAYQSLFLVAATAGKALRLLSPLASPQTTVPRRDARCPVLGKVLCRDVLSDLAMADG